MAKAKKENKSEPLSKKEKIAFGIITGIAGALILLVILLNVNWGVSTEKRQILNQYPGLENANHVYEYITVEELTQMVDDNRAFHVLITNSASSRFVVTANTSAKNFGVNTIYLLNTSSIASNDLYRIVSLIGERYDDVFGTSANFLPTLVYFPGDNEEIGIQKSGSLNNDFVDRTTSELIEQHFRNCGYTLD